ncbi:hypothetical protein HGRIS_011218 [Hohenbuehelia grisea]|uniref:Uncharacterized protein n=1 Tax=Hohenbuehelia grisea TaxID=104357 RepID=A0ABR3JUG8_9AGAR
MDKQPNLEKLDVESDDARQRRLQNAFRKLNRHSPNPVASPSFNSSKALLVAETTDSLIPRVQAFLPRIEASNAVLAKRAREDPDSINMEKVCDGDSQYIEMNLGLGVFERGSKNMDVDEAELSSASSTSDSTISVSDETSEYDYDSDASSVIITCFVPLRPIKPLPKRRPRPGIVVLGD